MFITKGYTYTLITLITDHLFLVEVFIKKKARFQEGKNKEVVSKVCASFLPVVSVD